MAKTSRRQFLGILGGGIAGAAGGSLFGGIAGLVSGSGSRLQSIKTVSSNYTVQSTDETILADTTSGAFTVTLPPSSAFTNGITNLITIVKKSVDGNTVTVSTQGSDTFEDRGSTYLLPIRYGLIRTFTDGAGIWYFSNDFGTLRPNLGPSLAPDNGPAQGHNYEIFTGGAFISPGGGYSTAGGYNFRKSFTPYVVRSAMAYTLVPEQILLGDPATSLTIRGTGVFNLIGTPWSGFNLANQTVSGNGTPSPGLLRRNDTTNVFEGSIPDNGNTQRFKSFCQLWETGSYSPTGGTQFETDTVTFTNPQKDAKYFIHLELDDAGIGEILTYLIPLGGKTNTSFQVELQISTGTLTGFETVTWYAVRYGS